MFAGEYVDHGGNRCCGQDFMAGTICSLPPGHPGPHGTTCQVCSGDWYMGGCACSTSCTTEDECPCSDCEEAELNQATLEDCQATGFSGEGRCIEPATHGKFCAEHAGHVTVEEVAETFGVDPSVIPNIG